MRIVLALVVLLTATQAQAYCIRDYKTGEVIYCQ